MNDILIIKELSKSINGNQIVSNVSMNIKEGEIYGFLGENGAGKTTIMKLILNLLKSDMGIIEFNGQVINHNSYEYLKDIGCIIEYPIFYNHLTALDNLEIHCAYEGINGDSIDSVLTLVGLINVKNKKVSEFSLGMKQRLGIARALVNKPKLLILDEPINGLDPVGIRDVRAILKKVNKEWNTTILISSHIVAEVEAIADTIGIIKNGQMVETFNINNLQDDSSYLIDLELVEDDLDIVKTIIDGSITYDANPLNIKIKSNLNSQEIIKVLGEHNIKFNSIKSSKVSLEEYFINIIKGEHTNV